MAALCDIAIGCVMQDGGALVMARLRAWDTQALITQADVASISYTIAKRSTGEKVAGHTAVAATVADVIFDTIQTPANNPFWDVDPIGFNFALEIDASANSPFPQANTDYAITITVTLTSGNKAPFNAIVRSLKNYAS